MSVHNDKNKPFSFKNSADSKMGDSFETEKVLQSLIFNDQGLIPAIAQQYDTKEVLMMAWMNKEALEETISNSRVCYWSRSRKSLWRKGESSGQIQILKELRMDCDGDTLLLLVDQTGPACHTGRRNCFFLAVDQSENTHTKITDDPIIDPNDLYRK